jgi:hypothetical protein
LFAAVATRAASRLAGSPYPPPPQVAKQIISPGRKVSDAKGSSFSSWPLRCRFQFEEGAESWPPRTPFGANTSPSLPQKAVISPTSGPYSPSSAGPPSHSPGPRLSLAILREVTMIGYMLSSISIASSLIWPPS